MCGGSFLLLLSEEVGSAEGGQQQCAVAYRRVPVLARAVVARVVDVELFVLDTWVVDVLVDEEDLCVGDGCECKDERYGGD